MLTHPQGFYFERYGPAILLADCLAVLKAGMDVILDQGTELLVKRDITVIAGRDIILNALKDYARDQSNSFGLQIGFGKIGFDISRSRGLDEQLTPARIAANGNVTTHSGRDTLLNGGQILGDRVKVDVGSDKSGSISLYLFKTTLASRSMRATFRVGDL